MQLLKVIKSFGPAFKGLKTGFSSENNFRVHLLAAALVIAVAVFLKVQENDWLWLVASIGMVIMAEYLNTSIEKLTDLVSPGHHELAGKVKDLAAAGVLVAAITAAIIGAIIFSRYIF